jgi:hypothetical protein
MHRSGMHLQASAHHQIVAGVAEHHRRGAKCGERKLARGRSEQDDQARYPDGGRGYDAKGEFGIDEQHPKLGEE